MAIAFVIFNPAYSKRLLMNYHYVNNIFKLQKLPVFTLELVYEGRDPQIADAIYVKGNSYMFHKENLCRVLEKHIPSQFTKIAFLDGDIIFSDKNWYKRVSELLETHDIVQPFKICHWRDLTYKHSIRVRQSVVLMESKTFNWDYHPGFAWCFRRDWYNKFGFFDLAVAGGGDTVSCIIWMQLNYSNLQSLFSKVHDSFISAYNTPVPRITYLKDCVIYHLYHGRIINRKHTTRSRIFDGCPDITQMVITNSDGVYEWNPEFKEKMNLGFLKYFQERIDDDLSCNCSNKLPI